MELLGSNSWTIFVLMIILGFASDNVFAAPEKGDFSALLVFGDSVVDTGNNNGLASICKSNHPPYGQRFSGKIPTGRFSDGKVAPDFLASMLGLKETVPPYLHQNVSDDELITGVNFASGCSGLDDRTYAITERIPMSEQKQYLKNYISRLMRIVGREKAEQIVRDALVMIHVGGNDFLYHLDILPFNISINETVIRFNSSRSNNYGDFLLNKMQTFLEGVYSLGCRRMIVMGIPPLGCLPVTMTLLSPFSRKCVDSINSRVQYYNQKLATLLPQIQANLTGAQLIYVDIFVPLMDMIRNPHNYGLVETRKGCCGSGLFEFGPLCNRLTSPCANSSQYLFWDSVHPSEIIQHYFANQIFSALSKNYIL